MEIVDYSTVPLLSNSIPRILPNDHNHENPSSSKIKRCTRGGDIGSYLQLIQAFLVSLPCAFDAQQCFIIVFTDAATNAEWGLDTSSSSFLRGLPTSAFFVGSVVGGFVLSSLADSVLGRKNLLLLCTLIASVSSLLAAFSFNVLVYSALRFLCGFGRAPVATCALILCTEMVGTRFRGQVGVIGFVTFALGFLSLSPIAYLNRNNSWRDIYLWTSAPNLAYCVVVYFFVQESPRWLLVRGTSKEEEEKQVAVKTFRSISYTDASKHRSCTITLVDEQGGGAGGANNSNIGKSNNNNNHNNNDGITNPYSAMSILVSRNWSLRRLLAVTFISFGLGLITFGIPLGLSSLPFNIYLSVAVNAAAELCSSLVVILLIGNMYRRRWLLVGSIFSGACSVLVAAASQISGTAAVQVGLELASFSSGIMAMDLMLLYTTELFPTCVRSSALSIARQALVIGGACAPFLVVAGENNQFFSYGVFGGVMGFFGLFTLCLPETRGTVLCDTVEEEEMKMNEAVVNCR